MEGCLAVLMLSQRASAVSKHAQSRSAFPSSLSPIQHDLAAAALRHQIETPGVFRRLHAVG